ncbi:ABC transporter substrate-binding protein [Cytobacillus kochii]|uniref:ABC transporter substrate-binding protein n=1 Tax=Cytobacillus kochii TaxID=859143 RepID=UPI001CD20F0F|nr:ABC transporter substrate-binding protein [Cytobacillus kochii]MCA1026917.1 ABC transporter substrate-binding protein [Cytobacillus kochii]MCM3322661.1 ABC transporter substrate-binding protein [Cytobacillus kochii]MCM3344860.1 ABC transporter substrate-binding protein [Cytobacillus kochii]MDM5209403.1 ABC transporter substrate-binding protein [Cytobacillus kochii]
MKAKKSFLLLLLLVSTAMFALIGCSNNESTASEDEKDKEVETTTDQPSETEYPITIEHAFGETVIEEKPERVATIQWANHDVVLALGVEPVGFSAANYGVEDGSGLLPWTTKKLEELDIKDPNIYQDTDGLDFEAIADSNPDVILAGYSGITQEDYDLLTQIAPVVAYPTTPWTTTWREQVLLNAKGMGMEKEGEQLIKDTEDLVAEKVAEYPELKGKKVVWANFSANDLSQFHLYTPADPRVSFLMEMGLETPESITNLIEDENAFSLSLSAENADVLNDADIIIGYNDESTYDAVKADARLGKIKAIERGSVVFIGNNTPLAASGNPNPLSIEYTIDEYLELIADAVEKVDE